MLARGPTGQQPASVPQFDNRQAALQHCPSILANSVGAGVDEDVGRGRLRRPRTLTIGEVRTLRGLPR